MAAGENQTSSLETEGADLLDDRELDFDHETIIPIISNSFRMEQIFKHISTLTEKIAQTPRRRSPDEVPSVYQQLTREWADSIQYPLPDDSDLARVAQYFQVRNAKDLGQAKRKYLHFLRSYLLNPRSPKDAPPPKPRETFSDTVAELGYPEFPQGIEDPLWQLAKLPLPIYITTSYFNFLERALLLAGKTPRTQVCSWSGGKAQKAEHLPDADLEPTPEMPVVYHLFGLEDYPSTMVLSEDDYMNWQISVTEELSQQITNTTAPGIPLQLRDALAAKDALLVILGYNFQDWEFRMLFRFICKFRKGEDFRYGTVIQLEPRPKNTEYRDNALGYLRQYFDIKRSDVKWTTAETYIERLSRAYDRYKGVIE